MYAAIVLAISAPVFYFATERLYLNEADSTLMLHKKEFLQNTIPNLKQTDIAAWNSFNRNIKIDSTKTISKDSLFFSTYYDTLDAEMEPYRELNFPVTIQNKTYTYSERINLVESEDLVQNIVFLFLAIMALLLAGLLIITKRISHNLWKPFYKTLHEIEAFEIDRNKQPVFAQTRTEEFARLNRSIQKLVEKNTAIYKSQREFIENAAHELQTPLAVFQAKIDTLMQRADVTKEQAAILETLNDNVSRLNRLNKNLLLLSTIEHDQYSPTESFSLNTLVQKNLAFFTEQAKAKQITISTDLQQETTIRANPVLTEILISNLFLNAIRHNIQNGQIRISIQNKTLSIVNSGRDQSLHAGKIFNRFSKTDPSGHGTGLGLSIVKRIAGLYNWPVTYLFTDGLHSFSIQF